MSLTKISLMCCLGTFVGCASVHSPTGRDFARNMRVLNPIQFSIFPGKVYVVESDRAVFLADLLENVSQENFHTWVESFPAPNNAMHRLGQGTLSGLRWNPKPTSFDALIEANDPTVYRLVDPMRLLEVVNRPLTGLSYNLTVERRLQGLKTTLERAILLAEGDPSGSRQVVICTNVLAMTDGSLAMNGSTSKRQKKDELEEQVIIFSSEMTEGSSVQTRADTRTFSLEDGVWSFMIQVHGNTVLHAEFRQLVVNPANTISGIDFALGLSRSAVIGLVEPETRTGR